MMIEHVGAGAAAPKWDLQKAYGLNPSHIQTHNLHYPR